MYKHCIHITAFAKSVKARETKKKLVNLEHTTGDDGKIINKFPAHLN